MAKANTCAEWAMSLGRKKKQAKSENAETIPT